MRRPLAAADVDTQAGPDDPVADAVRRADLAALWQAIRALPRSQRDALLLREFGGLRYDELAVALAVTEPAVESLLVRARSRLREQLRHVYASLAPAIRFLVSSGTPAIAAKAAALGVGAAAVTGGVAVAPEMLTRHHLRPPSTVVTTAVPPRQRIVHLERAVLRVPPAPAAAQPTVTTVAPPAHRRRARDHERSDDREQEVTTAADDVTTGAEASPAPVTTLPDDGPDPGATVSGRGQEGGDGGNGPDSRSEGDGGDG